MKTKLIILLLLFTVTITLGAQTVHDPNNEIYKDIDRWFVQGYITEFLPMVRPYPVKLIDKILEQVILNGDEQAQEKAANYREVLSPGSRSFHVGGHGFIQGNEDEKNIIAAPLFEGLVHINEQFNASYNLTFFSFTNSRGEQFVVPGNYTQFPDLVDDLADVGKFRILQNWTSLVSYGSSEVYLQAGLSRSSYGPFYDNGIVVGPQAPRAGHFSFVYWEDLYSFEILFQTLIATDDYGMGNFPTKYNIIHNFNFRPIKNLEFGLVQTLVYGQRLDLLYLVPFSYLFGSQTINGFDDNAFIGLNLRWRPKNGLLFNGQVYIDDFHFNGFLSGDIYFKAAGEIGFSWAPANSILSKLDFDYTLVTPYTYSHWHETKGARYNGLSEPTNPLSKPNGPLGSRDPRSRTGNFLNYTHMGRNIGPDLEPNSDRISLRTRWNVINNLDFYFTGYMIRHGNASEGKEFLDPEFHNGSIFDMGTTDPWLTGIENDQNYYKEMYILNQSVLETRLGGTFGAAWTLPTNFGIFKFMADYGIQHTWNKYLIKDNNGLDHFWSVGGMWRF